MPNNWYHNRGETYVPPKLCDNANCLYGDRVGRSDNVERTHIEHGSYWELSFEHYKCNHCGHTWKEEW